MGGCENRQKRRSDLAGRVPLPSPSRPPVAGREERGRFWAEIAAGLSSEDAAAAANVPQAIGARWFRSADGMPPAMFGPSAKPLSGRYLSFAEREEVALLRAQGRSMQEVARRIGRAASTIPASCGGTPPLAVAAWSIARRPHSGTPSDRLVGQNRRSLRSIRPYALMCKSAWPEWSSLQAGLQFLVDRVMERAASWTAAGPPTGARLEPRADRTAPIGRLP
jgi:hypothetical protein